MITNEQQNAGNVNLSDLIQLLVQALQNSKPAQPQVSKPQGTTGTTQPSSPQGTTQQPTPQVSQAKPQQPVQNNTGQQQPDRLLALQKMVEELKVKMAQKNQNPAPTPNRTAWNSTNPTLVQPQPLSFPCQLGDASFATAAQLGQHMMDVHNAANTLGNPALGPGYSIPQTEQLPVSYKPIVAPSLSNLVSTQSLRDRVLANIEAIRARRQLL